MKKKITLNRLAVFLILCLSALNMSKAATTLVNFGQVATGTLSYSVGNLADASPRRLVIKSNGTDATTTLTAADDGFNATTGATKLGSTSNIGSNLESKSYIKFTADANDTVTFYFYATSTNTNKKINVSDSTNTSAYIYSFPYSILIKNKLYSVKYIVPTSGKTYYFSVDNTLCCSAIKFSPAITGPQAPRVKSLSIAGTSGTSVVDSFKVNLPYTSYTHGVTVVNTSDIIATTDSSAVTTQIQKHGVDVTSFTVGDTLTYSVSKNSLTKTYYVFTSANVPSPSINTPTNATQSVKQGVAIAPIVFTISDAVSGSAIGLPSGVTFDFATKTISGTPDNTNDFKAYSYTVGVKGLAGGVPDTMTVSGTITVKDPAIKEILYLTALTASSTPAISADVFLNQLKANSAYSVTTRAALTSGAPYNYSGYDLIVLHESLTGGDAATANTEVNLIKTVDKPILNLKSYFYTAGTTPRWGWGTPSNGDNRAAVNVIQKTHPIFTTPNTVNITGDSVVLLTTYVAKNIQPTSILSGFAIAQTSSAANVAIHEIPAATRVGVSSTSKYLLVSMLSVQSANLSSDALKLLGNSVTYLLDPSAAFIPKSTDVTLSDLQIDGVTVAGFAAATTTYTVATGVVGNVSASATAGVLANVAITQATDINAPNNVATILVTAENGSTKTYTVTFTVPTSTNEAVKSSNVYAAGSSVVVDAEAGAKVSILNIAGSVVYSTVTSSNKETVSLEKGAYVVVVDGVSKTVIIK